MAIIIDNQVEDISDDLFKLIEETVNTVASYEKCPYDYEVSIVITDNANIKIINNEYRGKNSETDVLSFPLIPFDMPSRFEIVEDDDEYFDLDSDALLLGDIVLSYDKAIEQANDYGHSLKREIAFLVIHSMLHLFGYDHMDPVDEKVMIERQKLILEVMGIDRSL